MGIAQALSGKCSMAREYGDYRQAEILAHRGLEIARHLEDARSVADARQSSRAYRHGSGGHWKRARDFTDKCSRLIAILTIP